jgi:NAD(P)H dehydrogenase (quinone)
MNILILHAHPEPNSFSSSLKNVAVEHFQAKGDEVLVKDLYQMNFNPIGRDIDFQSVSNPEYFNYMKEQMNAFMNNSFTPELKAEMEALVWADLLLLNFPLWWTSMPAIMKGWFDRVIAFGFAYHPKDKSYKTGVFRHKKAMCCITTGGTQQAYSAEGEHGDINSLLYPVHHGLLYFTGMDVLPPFYAWRAHLSDTATLGNYIGQYKLHLSKINEYEPLF